MAKVSLSQIKKRVPEILNTKLFNNAPIMITKGSTTSLLKGFMLKETPRSATLCFWFYPDIQISHNNGFPGYYQEIIFRGNPSSGGLSAILKYEYTKV